MEPPETKTAAAVSSVIQMTGVTVPAIDDPDTALVEAVDWSVAARDYWIVGARPGGGKSDFLAVAAGLLRPLRGTHHLFGRDMTGLHGDEPLPERLRVGLVFEDGGRLFNAMTVRENVTLPLRYHHNHDLDEVRDQVEATLDLVGLTALANNAAGRISRSWRQLAALARALVLQPEVLLLDNPLAGLDLRQVRWWLEFLAALTTGHAFLNRRPLTLVVTTDDLRPWREYGGCFALINENRWVPIGSRAALDRCQEPLLHELLVDAASVD
jgi:ABC-type transporter Mla maintaining outer membrane lipid asymmetry ATPase subunit MlaF